MNYVPKINRRSFVVGTAAVGGGLALGFDLPFGGPQVVRAADGSPELSAWVVIRPDDTVVIRIARSEMGQGTLTGLAQLVAEELECDWSKVTTEYPTPGQNVARKRAWGDFSTGGSRGIRKSHEYVRKAARAARMMLIQAAANEWKVPAAECSRGKQRDHAHARPAARPPTARSPKPRPSWSAEGRQAQGPEGLEDRRQAAQAARHRRQGRRQEGLRHRRQAARHAQRRDQAMPGVRRQGEELRRRQGHRHEGRQEGRAGRRHRRGRRRRHLVARQDRARRAADRLGRRPATPRSQSATIAKMLEEGLDAEQAFVGNKNGDAKAALAGAAKKVEAVYCLSVPEPRGMEPMNATALYTADKCEVWCGTQNGEAAFAAALAASGLPADKCDVHKIMLGGGFGRRGAFHDYVTQAVQIAKQMPGTPVKLLWSREEDMTHGRYHPITQCKLVGALDADDNLTGAAHAHFRPVDPGRRAPGRLWIRRHGSRRRSRASTRPAKRRFGYTVPNLLIDHAMRNPHVPPGFWRGVNINQNAIYLECFMDELAQCGRAGSARVPAQADGEASEASRGAQRRGREDRLGQAGAARRLPRHCAAHGLRQLRRRRPPKSR